MQRSGQDPVSSLRRAAMGTSVPDEVPDDDLDRYIADIILEEARRKDAQYREVGVSAYRSSPPRPMRTNKRFLTSVIRGVDSHNQRQEQEFAAEARRASSSHLDQALTAPGERSEDRRTREASPEHRHRHRYHHDAPPRRHHREASPERRHRHRDKSPDRSHRRRHSPDREHRHRHRHRHRHSSKREYRSHRRRHGSVSPRSSPEPGPPPPPPVRAWDVGKDLTF